MNMENRSGSSHLAAQGLTLGRPPSLTRGLPPSQLDEGSLTSPEVLMGSQPHLAGEPKKQNCECEGGRLESGIRDVFIVLVEGG